MGASLPEITADIFIDGSGFTISGDSQYRIFVVGGGAHVVIDRLTLANGSGDWDGGALLVHGDSELTVTNSIFSNNSTVHAGGAILVRDSEAIIFSSSFYNNSAEWGGAIHVWDSGTLTANNVTFDGNITDSRGSAVDIRSQSAALTDVRFFNNHGGTHVVIASSEASVTINCYFELSDNSPNTLDPDVIFTNSDCVGNVGAQSQSEPASAPAEVVVSGELTVGGSCSLADAISAANEDRAVGGCPAGEGADTIALTADITLSTELPPIESEIMLEGGGHAISGDDRYRIFIVGESGVMTIKGATLRNGNVRDGSAALRCVQDRNVSDKWGGAICNVGRLSIRDSVISNSSAQNGGAVFSQNELSVTDSKFSGNTAAYGGAIFNWGELSVTGSEFRDNSGHVANAEGGAIYNFEGRLSIVDSLFSGNRAPVGGALFSDGELSVTGSVFGNNGADGNGGAIASEGELLVTDSVFDGNAAFRSGGAIVGTGEVSVSGSVFNGNSARGGGAIASGHKLSVTDSKFSGNSAAGEGGAIDSFGELSVTGSEFAGNSADRGGAILFDGDKANVAGSTFSDNSPEDCVGVECVSVPGGGRTATTSAQQDSSATLESAPPGAIIVVEGELPALEAQTETVIIQPAVTCPAANLLSGSHAVRLGSSDIYSDLRTGPSTEREAFARIHGGTIVYILAGPVTADNYYWYQARTVDESEPEQGWVAYGPVIHPNCRTFFEFYDAPSPTVLAIHAAQEDEELNGNIIVDDTCNLRQAITAANEDREVGDCEQGNGADVIVLERDAGGCLASGRGSGPLVVSSDITLLGRQYSIENTCGIRVNSGSLSLTKVTLDGTELRVEDNAKLTVDKSVFLSDLISNSGTLNIDTTQFSGVAIENYGELTVENSTLMPSSSNYVYSGGSQRRSRDLIRNDGGTLEVSGTQFVGSEEIGIEAIVNLSDGTADISNSTFTNFRNFSIGAQGAAVRNYGELHFDGCTFSRNHSGDRGGAIFNSSEPGVEVTIKNCLFEDNEAKWGGAIFNDVTSGHIQIEGTTFVGNKAHKAGGAIRNLANITIVDSVFLNNHGPDVDAVWGELGREIALEAFIKVSIYLLEKKTSWALLGPIGWAGTGYSVGRILYSGAAGNGTGGAISNRHHATIHKSHFAGNATVHGGAIHGIGSLELEDSSFYYNYSASGGAVEGKGDSATMLIKRGTFVGNHAGEAGGAILAENGSNLALYDSEFRNNESNHVGGAIYLASGSHEIRNSDFIQSGARWFGPALYVTKTAVLSAFDIELIDNRSPRPILGNQSTDHCTIPIDHAVYCEIPETRWGGPFLDTENPLDALSNPQNQLIPNRVDQLRRTDGSIGQNSIGNTNIQCRNGAASASFVSYSPRNYCMAETGGVSDLEA